MLYRTPRPEPIDIQVLDQVNAMRDELRHTVRQPPAKRTRDLRKALTASAIAASNTIEGYQVEARDVADLLDGEREVEASDENKAETLAYQQAMTYIQSLHDARLIRSAPLCRAASRVSRSVTPEGRRRPRGSRRSHRTRGRSAARPPTRRSPRARRPGAAGCAR